MHELNPDLLTGFRADLVQTWDFCIRTLPQPTGANAATAKGGATEGLLFGLSMGYLFVLTVQFLLVSLPSSKSWVVSEPANRDHFTGTGMEFLAQ
mmetsp:Transcript_22733/g.91059  ORF Transcript_22733/g.91059 Transcript_22733/m.91059 type:complete len:95 (+) Transcript_22733:420-704(+)